PDQSIQLLRRTLRYPKGPWGPTDPPCIPTGYFSRVTAFSNCSISSLSTDEKLWRMKTVEAAMDGNSCQLLFADVGIK
ncbi:hypothetical protein VIGAN_UM190600, partial [Vigna angularis var. angularis]